MLRTCVCQCIRGMLLKTCTLRKKINVGLEYEIEPVFSMCCIFRKDPHRVAEKEAVRNDDRIVRRADRALVLVQFAQLSG